MRWGGVVVNAAAEQAQGTVAAPELPALLHTVIGVLTSPGGGLKAAMAWAKPREEIYRGPATANLPHVIFEAPPGVVITEAKGPGPLYEPYRNPLKEGEHSAEAMVLVSAPGVSAGGRAASLEDVAPTAARLLGLDAGGMDGRPLF
jgi:hypothetical protein